ncbi:piercer of microtubule wall 1 protein [Macrotis lagotis]|uniref:piercer of microtubule wall 1 protein n=1 Tax=Macrotis lagotis TaxID=92651 RepID=UPI003D68A820
MAWNCIVPLRTNSFKSSSRLLSNRMFAALENSALFYLVVLLVFPPKLLLCYTKGKMPEETPQKSDQDEQKAEDYSEKTSDYYRVSHNLPVRFNNPGWFRGYRTKETHPAYRTSNQTYGSRAPTVHEMPKTFNSKSHTFSQQYSSCGMYRNNGFNVYTDKSVVTGTDNLITHYDRLNFHPSYNPNKPSICD